MEKSIHSIPLVLGIDEMIEQAKHLVDFVCMCTSVISFPVALLALYKHLKERIMAYFFDSYRCSLCGKKYFREFVIGFGDENYNT